MARIRIQVAGDPSFLTRKVIDGGPILNTFTNSNNARYDGGYFMDPPSYFPLINGGVIPTAGSDKFDPAFDYTAVHTYEIEVDIDEGA